MRHLIKRQIFSLTISTERDAFDLQHQVSQVQQREVLPALQKVLDEISTDDQVICIERLEIDLGRLPVKDFMNERWVPLLEAVVRRQLQKMMEAKDDESAVLILRPQCSGIFRQWLFSMQHGYLPWNAGKTDDAWYLQVLEAIATDAGVVQELRSTLARDAVVVERIVRQHSVSFLIALTESLTAEKQERLRAAVEEIWVLVGWLVRKGRRGLGVTHRMMEVEAWKKILSIAVLPAVNTGAPRGLTTDALLVQLLRMFFSLQQLASAGELGAGLPVLSSAIEKVQKSGPVDGHAAGREVSGSGTPESGLPENKVSGSSLDDKDVRRRDGVDRKDRMDLAGGMGQADHGGKVGETDGADQIDHGDEAGAAAPADQVVRAVRVDEADSKGRRGRTDRMAEMDEGDRKDRRGRMDRVDEGDVKGRGDGMNHARGTGRADQVDHEGKTGETDGADQVDHEGEAVPVDRAVRANEADSKGRRDRTDRMAEMDEGDRKDRRDWVDRVDEMDESDGKSRRDWMDRADGADKKGRGDRMDRLDEVDRMDQAGRTGRADQVDHAGGTGRVRQMEQPGGPDQAEIPVGTGKKKSKGPAEIMGGEEIFIENAGVILLHPFLHSFFKILHFVGGGKFRTPELHARALYLIHFMATGRTEAQEHDLVIAKILCAYPLDEPVDRDVELTETELQEAGNLLTAAIVQWEILKSTSHDGLREGFLQRPGKLHAKGNDVYLQVETGSIDMLLDHLPWNLGIIKLPWMEYILRVEWR